MANHRFLVRRQDGIGPHPDDHPCASCGQPKSAPVHDVPRPPRTETVAQAYNRGYENGYIQALDSVAASAAGLKPFDAEAVARDIDFCLEAGDVEKARQQLGRLIALLRVVEAVSPE